MPKTPRSQLHALCPLRLALCFFLPAPCSVLPALLFLIELLDKSRGFDLSHYTLIDKHSRIRRSGFGIARRQVIEKTFHSFRSRQQIIRIRRRIRLVGAFESLGIRDTQISGPDCLCFFFVCLVEMNRFDHGAGELEHHGSLRFHNGFARKPGVPPERYLERADIEEVSKAESHGLLHKRFGDNRELDHPFRQSRESFRVAAGSDNLGVSIGVDSQSSERKTKSGIGSAADSIDSANLPFQLVGTCDAFLGYDVIDEG